MASTAPTPRTWTLRFKHSKTTILLHIDPLQKLSTVKAELLKAITQTNPSGTFNNQPIPSSPDSIRLAKPIDHNDLSLGWVALDQPDLDLDDADEEVDVKGKGMRRSKGGKNEGLADCAQGVGLRDGGAVAFKFRVEGESGLEGEDEAIVVEEVEERWEVDVPTMEGTFDEEGDAEAGG